MLIVAEATAPDFGDTVDDHKAGHDDIEKYPYEIMEQMPIITPAMKLTVNV